MPPSVPLDHCHAHISRRRRSEPRPSSVVPCTTVLGRPRASRPASFSLSSTRPDRFNFFRATCERLSTCNLQLASGATPAVRVRTRANARLSERARRAYHLSFRSRRATFRPARERRKAYFQLRAFQPQQHEHTLSELELPRLLAPDLPSDRYLHDTRPNGRTPLDARPMNGTTSVF